MSELFREQSSPWTHIAETHLKRTYDTIAEFVVQALDEVVGDDYVRKELSKVTTASLLEAAINAAKELQRLLNDERGHLITYNHCNTDNIQNDRQSRMKAAVRKALAETRDDDWRRKVHISNTQVDIDRLISGIERRIIVDMDTQACEDALSGLQAYYKVILSVSNH